jgi:hypothetical protein
MGVALYQNPRDRRWCLVEIPDGWHRADPLPTDKTSETWFDTKEVAIIAPVGRVAQFVGPRPFEKIGERSRL